MGTVLQAGPGPIQPRPARAAGEGGAARHEGGAAAHTKAGRSGEGTRRGGWPRRRGDPIWVENAEGGGPGPTAGALSSLRPASPKAGTTAAGNASQISDGA